MMRGATPPTVPLKLKPDGLATRQQPPKFPVKKSISARGDGGIWHDSCIHAGVGHEGKFLLSYSRACCRPAVLEWLRSSPVRPSFGTRRDFFGADLRPRTAALPGRARHQGQSRAAPQRNPHRQGDSTRKPKGGHGGPACAPRGSCRRAARAGIRVDAGSLAMARELGVGARSLGRAAASQRRLDHRPVDQNWTGLGLDSGLLAVAGRSSGLRFAPPRG
jgi:hypothetical protein